MSIKNKSSNVAVVSNNTFEATKAVNLHNYDLTSALQTSLDFNVLLNIFSEKIKHLIPHNGFV
ncbi:MAG: GGDEF domain-containing protein, partial [Methylococcales bacterium]|nr:GGDEF domain-containing protein [Methylococcales bacterium]